MKTKKLALSVLRVAPAFAILAVIGCAVAYFMHVPLQRLGPVVLVPLIVAFLMSRIAVLVIPDTKLTPEQEAEVALVPILAKALVILIFVGGAVTLASLLSAGAYQVIKLNSTSLAALHLAMNAGLLTVASGFALVITAFAAVIHRPALKVVADADLAAFWQFARCPGAIAILLFGSVGKHPSHF